MSQLVFDAQLMVSISTLHIRVDSIDMYVYTSYRLRSYLSSQIDKQSKEDEDAWEAVRASRDKERYQSLDRLSEIEEKLNDPKTPQPEKQRLKKERSNLQCESHPDSLDSCSIADWKSEQITDD